jgi:3'-phosphoadenosine 5'-phosphosulfate sulfotransferase (PAPS reductase)/FAD synthetase
MTNKQTNSQVPVRHILSLSGGKDSTALAIFMRDKVPEMEYVFCDTLKEMDETYEYLNRVEAYLGKPIIRLNAKAGFDHWFKILEGYLPSVQQRWCTLMLKLKPFEEFIGEQEVISYIGLRADERYRGVVTHKPNGVLTHKPNVTTVYPFIEYGIDYRGVIKILEESGISMPPYLAWGRTHSGCYFCFFQKPIEWVRLLERHPEKFEQAMKYETLTDEQKGRTFTWIEGMPLSELKKPENVAMIKKRFEERQSQLRERKTNKTLIETLGGLEDTSEAPKPCLICHL